MLRAKKGQDDKVLVATCTSANGKPPSVVSWETRLKGEAEYQEIRNPNGTVTVISRYRLVPSREAHQQSLACVVNYHMDRFRESLTLNVQCEWGSLWRASGWAYRLSTPAPLPLLLSSCTARPFLLPFPPWGALSSPLLFLAPPSLPLSLLLHSPAASACRVCNLHPPLHASPSCSCFHVTVPSIPSLSEAPAPQVLLFWPHPFQTLSLAPQMNPR